MSLGRQIEAIHPTAKPLVDYRVQDDGAGPYIAHWNAEKLGAQPTAQQLGAAQLRKRRTVKAVYDAIGALTQAEQLKYLRAIAAVWTIENPAKAKQIQQALNLSMIDGDEPA